MRETFFLKGKKIYTEGSLKDWINTVKLAYPKAETLTGQMHYTWRHLDTVVAEAWPHRTKPGWWLRIRPMANYLEPGESI
jgi:hypothetical protein